MPISLKKWSSNLPYVSSQHRGITATPNEADMSLISGSESRVKSFIFVESEKKMRSGILYSVLIGFLALATIVGCTPKTATPPPVDIAGTIAVQLASSMMTQTVAAYSPTPPPATPTLPPTEVAITDTPEYVATNRPEVQTEPRASCWKGGPPSLGYKLDSNISFPKKVDLVGVGSIPGWYIVRNPYFNAPCWISATDLKIFSDIDLSKFPVMTPGTPK